MKEPPPPLLPLLRSQTHGELLAWLFLHPEREFSTSDLARLVGVSQPTVSRDATELVKAGLLTERRHGRLRLLRAAGETAVARPLTDLLAVTYGPLPVLTRALSQLDGVEEAYIYGSWAARYQGEPGAVPRDVDVLVVGDADEDELYEAARKTQTILGREVNVRRVTTRQWEDERGDDPFLTTVRNRPLVRLSLRGAPKP
jgi:DNA-binding transcriptional ArsR family regulator/DNA-binding XRE family transcriptional regulator